MVFLPSKELAENAYREGYAVPSFCVWNAETIETVLQAASDFSAPVMIMSGPGEFVVFPPEVMGEIARAVAKKYNVRAALHLDHGDSPALADQCLAAGYTSVMLDYSTRPFAENVKALKALAARCRSRAITVEGELGAVGRVGDGAGEGSKTSMLTIPADAQEYVRETAVDLLAVSIGNAHGLYTARPHFDFDLLAELRSKISIPFVLHGGSGTPEEDLRKAIGLGIAKVNVASELCQAIRDSFEAQWKMDRSRWLPQTFAETKKAMAPVLEKWIRITGAAGRA
ncbi:MAG: class II fructose-bisphosphate aldolase [Candidatus Aminicenantales bacterium]|jgi:tagatose 1,6-diphosphate aldolase GatY/KbaY